MTLAPVRALPGHVTIESGAMVMRTWTVRLLVLVGSAALVACGSSTGGRGFPGGGVTAAGGGTSSGSSATAGNSDFPSTATTTSQAHEGLAGKYTVTGTNNDGSVYRGKATVSGSGTQYHVSWLIGTGTSSGDGILTGDTFVVRFQGAVTGTGTVTYRLQPDGRLVGTWRVDGSSGEGTETLTPA